MCDTFVALPPVTQNSSVIFAKNADCQVNEAHMLEYLPRQKHLPGAVFRTTHIVIPQVEVTYETLLSKSFWTWGGEIGINEHGLAVGNEAVITTNQNEEKIDGLITMDLLRLALERARNCQEAIEVVSHLLEQYGQGGNCELSGNSHFDSSYIFSDSREAYLLETAGREWAAKKIASSGAISNALIIGSDWDLCSPKVSSSHLNWAASHGDVEITPKLGAYERQTVTSQGLAGAAGKITVETAFEILRHHGKDYHPAKGEVTKNVCVHAGPPVYRQWQTTGAMVTEVDQDGVLAWVTGTASTCLSIFKPLFLGVPIPDFGVPPVERFNPKTLWWKHELLHRRVMADFQTLMPEIRVDFDEQEKEYLQQAPSVKKGSDKEKTQFMEHCFQEAMLLTDQWTKRVARRANLSFSDIEYRLMWQKCNRQAEISGMPA